MIQRTKGTSKNRSMKKRIQTFRRSAINGSIIKLEEAYMYSDVEKSKQPVKKLGHRDCKATGGWLAVSMQNLAQH